MISGPAQTVVEPETTELRDLLRWGLAWLGPVLWIDERVADRLFTSSRLRQRAHLGSDDSRHLARRFLADLEARGIARPAEHGGYELADPDVAERRSSTEHLAPPLSEVAMAEAIIVYLDVAARGGDRPARRALAEAARLAGLHADDALVARTLWHGVYFAQHGQVDLWPVLLELAFDLDAQDLTVPELMEAARSVARARPWPETEEVLRRLVQAADAELREEAADAVRKTGDAVVRMSELLEARVHFGHQTRRWNPKMKRFIFGERNGIYIIDLEQTLQRLETAYTFVRDTVADGGSILFVGTKKQAQDPIRSYAEKCGMPYINERWLGGFLTNFETMSKRVAKMAEYRRMRDSGEFDAMPKKEALLISRELAKLERNLGGIAQMDKLPAAVFILDTKQEHIAVTEANRMRIPIVAVVDTNCDPDIIQYVIPGNDEGIRSNALMCRVISEAVEEGRLIASKRPGATPLTRARSGEEEAAVAAQQAEARRQAAAAAAEREARIAAQQAAPQPADEVIDAPAAEPTDPVEETPTDR